MWAARFLVVGAVLSLACVTGGLEGQRRVIASGDVVAGPCFQQCGKMTGVSPLQGLATASQLTCLETCPGVRTEQGQCAGADLLSSEHCWTEKRSVLVVTPRRNPS